MRKEPYPKIDSNEREPIACVYAGPDVLFGKPGRRKKIPETIDTVIPGTEMEIPDTVALSRIIGRAPDCDVVLDHNTISKRHCEIKKVRGKYLIRDLGSTNGTRVNGRPVGLEWVELPNGARLTLAEHTYWFAAIDWDHPSLGLLRPCPMGSF